MSVQPDGPFRVLDQRRAFEQIIAQIEEAIVAGTLRPGDRLPAERELAETFGVSRASVREALRVLERFGVVTARVGNGPHSGSVIADNASAGLTHALLLHAAVMSIPTKDIMDVRAVLEMYGARLASKEPDEAQMAALDAILEQMRGADTTEEFHRLDTEFHVTIAHASGNEVLPVIMESLRGAIQRHMLDGFDQHDDWRALSKSLLQQHQQILDAIKAGEGDRAATLLQEHIEHFYSKAMAPTRSRKRS
jgi:GntR family transcriptional regulator, transcriptional repressor for pyruvate dehydrogenase complex